MLSFLFTQKEENEVKALLSKFTNKIKVETVPFILDIGDVYNSAFITGSKLYKDGKIIDLSKLGYE